MMSHRTVQAALAAILVSACGAPVSAMGAAPQPARVSAAAIDAKLASASRAFALTGDDAAALRDALANPLVFTPIAGEMETTGELIVCAKRSKRASAAARIAPSIVRSSAFVDHHVVKVPRGLTEGEAAAMLMATGDYELVEPNWRVFPIATVPNDSQYGSSWQHNNIQSALAWDIHTGESDVIVAVCDSGVDLDHPDLQAALVPGYNSVNNRAQADGGNVDDINGHGTFVAGCAAAQGNNGTGVVGAGWDFSVMPIRVSNNTDGTANAFDIQEGALWAVEHGAKVINASYSGATAGSNGLTALNIARQGGLYLYAAGNDSLRIVPNAPDLIIVGSTRSNDTLSGFSNYGPAVDIVAPGSSVRSTRRGGGYGNGSGTSYASPVAAGVTAMIFSYRDDLSPWDVQDILYTSVDDLGVPGIDEFYGRGRVNTFNALNVATGYEPRTLLPIDLSFADASWDDVFDVSGGSVSIQADPEAPQGASALMLENGSQILSVPLAGRSVSDPSELSLGIVFRAQDALQGDTLVAEVLDDQGVWQTVATHAASGSNTDGYVRIDAPLDLSFAYHGVRVRLSANTSGAGARFLVDRLTLNSEEILATAPLVDSFSSGQFASVRWSDTSGASIGFDGPDHAASLTDGAVLESTDIPMAQFGIVPAYFRFDASSADADAGDSLKVEIRGIGGAWNTIATISGDELSALGSVFEFESIIFAWGIDDTRVRLTASGDATILVDDVYYGTEMLGGPCSVADFSEPFGELDFFDLSAFLSALSANDPSADLNPDGSYDFFDVSAYLDLYGQGCP